MKTLVKSCMNKYWETFELLLDEKTIQGVNELVAVRTNGTAPVLTKEEIMQCYRGKEIPEHLKAKYECYECYSYQAPLCNIVSSILSHKIQFRD